MVKMSSVKQISIFTMHVLAFVLANFGKTVQFSTADSSFNPFKNVRVTSAYGWPFLGFFVNDSEFSFGFGAALNLIVCVGSVFLIARLLNKSNNERTAHFFRIHLSTMIIMAVIASLYL